MKPIPAIDEAGNWIEAELQNGATMTLMAICPDDAGYSYAITLQGEYGVRVPPDIFKDWPAVRERVERARLVGASVEVRVHPGGAITVRAIDNGGNAKSFAERSKPSFAEALEREAATARDNIERRRPYEHIEWRDLVLLISAARAASGE